MLFAASECDLQEILFIHYGKAFRITTCVRPLFGSVYPGLTGRRLKGLGGWSRPAPQGLNSLAADQFLVLCDGVSDCLLILDMEAFFQIGGGVVEIDTRGI